jgi:hypothetical protein
MGDKTLMKKNFLLFLATVCLNADISVEQIDKMIVKIHEQRAGVELKTLESTENPFVRLQQENNTTTFATATETEEKITLNAIVNGKAYINDGWKSIDDSIMGYTLKYIGNSGVVLRDGNQIKKLYLYQKKDNFITLEER